MSTFSRSPTLPLLSARATFQHSSDGLRVDSEDASLLFQGASATLLESVRGSLDGTNRLADLAQERFSQPALGAVLSILGEEGLVLDAAAMTQAETMEAFLAACFAECRFWNRELLSQPFWQKVLSGTASRNVLLGWGVEFFHYVEAANEHMAMAVAQCRDDAVLRRWLADHYAEEYDHSGIFLQGLVGAGLDRQQSQEAPPLPSTRALIDFLTELAHSDTHAYLGAFGLMQSNREGATRQAIDQFYGFLSQQYPFAAEMFSGFQRHAELDVELKHQRIVLERLCARQGLRPAALSRQVATAVRATAEHFMLFFEGILDFYGAADAPLPRRPLDIRTVK